ncbi:MAG: hypothetical protein ACUVX9_16400, partial [Anaerolineae bacterium]
LKGIATSSPSSPFSTPSAAEGLTGFEAWAALVDGRLAATMLTYQMGDYGHVLTAQSRREYLEARVNNALCFTMTQALLSRPSVRAILYSLHSLDAPSSVDEFKFRMGYAPKPVRQCVVFHPALAPLIRRGSHAVVRWLLRLGDGQAFLAKAEGMMRFYLEGLRPVEKQTWPEPLRRRLPWLEGEHGTLAETDRGEMPADVSLTAAVSERAARTIHGQACL